MGRRQEENPQAGECDALLPAGSLGMFPRTGLKCDVYLCASALSPDLLRSASPVASPNGVHAPKPYAGAVQGHSSCGALSRRYLLIRTEGWGGGKGGNLLNMVFLLVLGGLVLLLFLGYWFLDWFG